MLRSPRAGHSEVRVNVGYDIGAQVQNLSKKQLLGSLYLPTSPDRSPVTRRSSYKCLDQGCSTQHGEDTRSR